MGANVQRDAAVGILAGNLEKAGIYGIELDLYGFIYDDGRRQVMISDSEMEVAEAAYRHAAAGDAISPVYSHSQRLYGTPYEMEKEKEKVVEVFWQELSIGKQSEPLLRLQLEAECVLNQPPAQCYSGFTYDIDGRQEAFVDAYFPQTLCKWLQKQTSGSRVGSIIFLEKQRGALVPPYEQLRQFRNSLLAHT